MSPSIISFSPFSSTPLILSAVSLVLLFRHPLCPRPLSFSLFILAYYNKKVSSKVSYEVYKQALDDAIDRLGLNPQRVYKEYAGVLNKLKYARPPQFKRVFVPVSRALKDRALDQAIDELYRIKQTVRLGAEATPRLDRHRCGNPKYPCPFRFACLAVDEEQDYISILNKTMVKDEEAFEAFTEEMFVIEG